MSHSPFLIQSPHLQELSNNKIYHGFFTRKGGVSNGIYASLNCALNTEDPQENVYRNRQKIMETFSLDPKKLVCLQQIHSTKVACIDAHNYQQSFQADALVTKEKNIALGVLTADCGPILFYDTENGVIGAAHAGWRGALDNIMEETIQHMEKLGAKRPSIIASLGPCLGPDNYEVTGDFMDAFLEKDPTYQCYFQQKGATNCFLFNLWHFILDRMEESGIQSSCMRICTYANEDLFFSFRRKTHNKEKDYGRQLSLIALKDNIPSNQ